MDNVHHTVWANGFVLWTGFLLHPSAHAELVFENQDKIPNSSQGHSGSLRVTPDKAAIKRSSKEGLALSEWLFAFAFCSLFLQKIRVAPGGSLSHPYPRLHQVPWTQFNHKRHHLRFPISTSFPPSAFKVKLKRAIPHLQAVKTPSTWNFNSSTWDKFQLPVPSSLTEWRGISYMCRHLV